MQPQRPKPVCPGGSDASKFMTLKTVLRKSTQNHQPHHSPPQHHDQHHDHDHQEQSTPARPEEDTERRQHKRKRASAVLRDFLIPSSSTTAGGGRRGMMEDAGRRPLIVHEESKHQHLEEVPLLLQLQDDDDEDDQQEVESEQQQQQHHHPDAPITNTSSFRLRNPEYSTGRGSSQQRSFDVSVTPSSSTQFQRQEDHPQEAEEEGDAQNKHKEAKGETSTPEKSGSLMMSGSKSLLASRQESSSDASSADDNKPQQQQPGDDGCGGGGRKKVKNSVALAAEHRIKLNEVAARALRQLTLMREAREFDTDTERVKELDSIQYDEVHFLEMEDISSMAPTFIVWEHLMKQPVMRSRGRIYGAGSPSPSSSASPQDAHSASDDDGNVGRRQRGPTSYRRATLSTQSRVEAVRNDQPSSARPVTNINNMNNTASAIATGGVVDQGNTVSSDRTATAGKSPATPPPAAAPLLSGGGGIGRRRLKMYPHAHLDFGIKVPEYNIRPGLNKAGPPSQCSPGADPILVEAIARTRFGAMTGVPAASIVIPTSVDELAASMSMSSASFHHHHHHSALPTSARRKSSCVKVAGEGGATEGEEAGDELLQQQQQQLAKRCGTKRDITTIITEKKKNEKKKKISPDRERSLIAQQLKTIFSPEILDQHSERLGAFAKRKFFEVDDSKQKQQQTQQHRQSSSLYSSHSGQHEGGGAVSSDSAQQQHTPQQKQRQPRRQNRHQQHQHPTSASTDAIRKDGSTTDIEAILEEVDRSLQADANTANVTSKDALRVNLATSPSTMNINTETPTSSPTTKTSSSPTSSPINTGGGSPFSPAAFARADRLLRTRDNFLFNPKVLSDERDFVYGGGMHVPQEVLDRYLKHMQRRGGAIAGGGGSNDEKVAAGIERGAILREMLRNADDTSGNAARMRTAQDELQWKQSYVKAAAVAAQSVVVEKATASTLGLTSIGIPVVGKRAQESADADEAAVVTQRMHAQWEQLMCKK